ncbi:Senescence-specific cysteine protease SAG39 [Camellia lanceoleosa]|uniref:Senescence-specific cysteine protease SAG39 n=2 Tax=Camellia lanceoleosa TaxID=1840588 RepID=A0ACC0GR15_9ERIC|nr:Senescence-specific cysteine protease SAG39 [Camellia lanceoleosa]KAI8001946.1 Senescence-specific cysteine protease SAG39 [Camellia lanceoleosa]
MTSHPRPSKTTPFRYKNEIVMPNKMDWRTKGDVTPVKDQGQCVGSRWPFSAIVATEGITQLITGSKEEEGQEDVHLWLWEAGGEEHYSEK